jgi:hypothetical protein
MLSYIAPTPVLLGPLPKIRSEHFTFPQGANRSFATCSNGHYFCATPAEA